MNIHLILNAHLDPVWLWPWQAGLDSALATCRSACDRLDSHPDIYYTRGEAWIYDMIETVDPPLFARIKAHVEAGRWEIVGGWWIQPDCNAPSGWAWEKQIEIGQRYFKSRFGIVPQVGYNVDSFGHAATLPKLMADHGQKFYVMMRPQESEMALPSRLFRWKGYEDGPEIVTFRIANGYCTRDITIDHLKASLKDLPEGVDDTMCFVGVGDHGGGPTEEQIAWIHEHKDDIPGVKLLFSTPQRFFDTIAPQRNNLPLVTGELQMHAVGCYTVHRGIKTALRRAEHILHQAQVHAPDLLDENVVDKSWQNVAFAQFHDTLGGTCLPSAYQAITDQLGFASAASDSALHIHLRRDIARLPGSTRQRIVAWNASERSWSGFVEFEPWMEWNGWQPHYRLIDEAGSEVPYQRMLTEAQTGGLTRLVFPATLGPDALATFAIDTREGASTTPVPNPATVDDTVLSNGCGVSVTTESISWNGLKLAAPILQLIEDKTDTWSHGVDRYNDDVAATAVWQDVAVVDGGPIVASTIRHGTIGDSRVTAEWRVFADTEAVELRLGVHWLEKFKVLKLTVPIAAGSTRIDGISGGNLCRDNDGKERPLRDWTLIDMTSTTLGIVAPDVFALDATADRVRFTLLRSPWLAWHDPHVGGQARGIVADQGNHEFRFVFQMGATADKLDDIAFGMQRPLLMADTTLGMVATQSK